VNKPVSSYEAFPALQVNLIMANRTNTLAVSIKT
jgi:hypothetical protein